MDKLIAILVAFFLFSGFGLNYAIDDPKGLIITFKNKKSEELYDVTAFRGKLKKAKGIELINVLCPDVTKEIVFDGESFQVGNDTDLMPIKGSIILVVVPRSTRFTIEFENEEVFIDGEWHPITNLRWKTWRYKGQQRNEVFF